MSVFSKDNLLAWCIVPFDARERSPKERAEMLQRLGIRALAYDWRERDIETFDEELHQLRAHGIRLAALWLSGGNPKDEKSVWDDPMLRAVLKFIERNDLNIEVWKTFGSGDLDAIADLDARYDAGADQINVLAKVFNDLGCSYGIYNHGGWGGEPQTMVEIAKRVDSEGVGIVYNFHHGHEHMPLMPDAFTAMLPYLMCVNLNGVTPGGPKILPLSEGEEDLNILRMVQDSGYAGPIGILDHRPDTDAEFSLTQNLDGMQRLLRKLGDEGALATYQ